MNTAKKAAASEPEPQVVPISEKPKATGLDRLREPFESNLVSVMCRSTKKDNPKQNCSKCRGYHGMPAIQLSYVGHAALTYRLLEVDQNWNWEPLALDEKGLPRIDSDGGMWIKLTVCGITRLGYGDAQGKTGGDAMKERIGDALRNAAMRFGAALDLWHKGDLHAAEIENETPTNGNGNGKYINWDERLEFLRNAKDLDELQKLFKTYAKEAHDMGNWDAVKRVTEVKDHMKAELAHAIA